MNLQYNGDFLSHLVPCQPFLVMEVGICPMYLMNIKFHSSEDTEAVNLCLS